MRIAIFGAGGVGGYFGGLLARAGHEVGFIARGAHLSALQERGLRVKSPHGDFQLPTVHASEDPAEIGTVEVLLLAVKHYQLQESLPRLPPLLGSETLVLPLLNGVDAHEILRSMLTRGVVVGGLCSISSLIEAPGVIRQESRLRRVIAGEIEPSPAPYLEELLQALSDSGVEAVHSSEILVDIWTKFLFIASFGCVSSLARASSGEILGAQPTRELLLKAMAEVEALARAQTIQLAPDVVDRALKTLQGFEPTTTSSMQRDVAEGRPFELDAFSGLILQRGQAYDVETPTFHAMDALLRPSLLRSTAPFNSSLPQ